MDFIPVNEPLLNGNEKKYLNECINTGWISSEGSFVRKFEEETAKYFNRLYSSSVTNGTIALEIALKVLGVKEGDEVILPDFSIISCVLAVLRNGAVPVLIDSYKDTFNMKVEDIESKISNKTKVIMIVHTYGLPVDYEPVKELALKYNLKILEDAAEAQGLFYKSQKCGSLGDVSTFSFYANKHITTGEGGMILSNDSSIDDKVKYYRNLCFNSKRRFVHDDLGWNARMSNISAALGLAQIEQIDLFLEKKQHIAREYEKYLSDNDYFYLPKKNNGYGDNIYWVYPIIIKENIDKNADFFINKLKEKGIGSRPFFFPTHLQPILQKKGYFKNESYPNSIYLANKGLYLPSGLGLDISKIHYICECLKKICKDNLK